MSENNIALLNQWVKESNRIVFFGGAGVSTESGIPDFRSTDGLYQNYEHTKSGHLSYAYPPETILSHSFFINHPEEFFEFYRDKMVYRSARPNITHHTLRELEDKGKLIAVVTQNIDGLHQMAGSRKVLELHGSVHRNYCMKCGHFYTLKEVLERMPVPHCGCGGIIKPDVVLYDEPLKEEVIVAAVKAISEADVLIVGGTSLKVYPAAGFLSYYSGSKMVLINKSATPIDSEADLLFSRPLGEVMGQLLI